MDLRRRFLCIPRNVYWEILSLVKTLAASRRSLFEVTYARTLYPANAHSQWLKVLSLVESSVLRSPTGVIDELSQESRRRFMPASGNVGSHHLLGLDRVSGIETVPCVDVASKPLEQEGAQPDKSSGQGISLVKPPSLRVQ
jgi:hypothetical protein